jgi:hypothetical protein
VRVEHAIKTATELVPKLTGKEAVEVHVLVQLAKRVRRAAKPIRQLADAIAPEASPLNQESLFDDPEEPG